MEAHDTERIAGPDAGDEVVHTSGAGGDLSTSETPEDVAVLYSWANLQGAKYRDFSASRREYRAQMRHRAAELLRQQELKAAAEAEAAAAASEAEAALAAAAAQSAKHPDPQEAEYARQLALYEADQAARKAASERLEAVRRADAAAYAASVAEHEAREIAEAQASSIRQAAQYAESEARLRQSGMHARAVVPGKISDPYAPPQLAEGGIFDQPGTPVADLEATRFRKVRDSLDQGSGSGHNHQRGMMPPTESPRPRGYRPDEPSGVRPQVGREVRYDHHEQRDRQPSGSSEPPTLNAYSDYGHGLPSTPYSEYKKATGGGELNIRPRPEIPASGQSGQFPRQEALASPPLRPPAPQPPAPERPQPPARVSEQPAWDMTRIQQRSSPPNHLPQSFTAGALENEFSDAWQPDAPPPPRAPVVSPQSYPATPQTSFSPLRPDPAAASPGGSEAAYRAGRGFNAPSSPVSAPPLWPSPSAPSSAPLSNFDRPDVQGSESSRRQQMAPSTRDRAYAPPPPAPPRTGPAWLYPSPQEITRLRPAAVAPSSPAAPSASASGYPAPRSSSGSDSGQKAGHLPAASSSPASSAFDTLQHSREHVASRWYALKGIFDHPNRVSSGEVATQPLQQAATPMLAVFSLAGGVGKTSLVATLGRTLSSMGEKVLLADTTSHGLLPFYFGASELLPGVVRTFSPPSGSTDAPIYLVSNDGNSSPTNAAEGSPDGRTGAHGGERSAPEAFAHHLTRDSRGMHRVLVDLTNTSVSMARQLVRLRAAFLVPLAPDMNSVISLQSLRRFFRGLVDAEGQPIEPYFVLNQFDSALPLHLDVREVLGQQLGRQLLPFVIRRTPSVSEALAEGMTVVDYAPESAIAQDYRNVATWLRSVAPPLNASTRSARWSER